MSQLRAFTMPKWGIEMAEGIVSEWQVAQGDAFSKGQILVGIETDKIVNEVEAEYDAVCLRRLADEGDTLAVGELLAVMGDAATPDAEVDAFIAQFVPAGGAASDVSDRAPEDKSPTTTSSQAPARSAAAPAVAIPDDIRISPRAAQAVGELMVDVNTVEGSGRHGRVQLQDVQTAARSVPVAPGDPVNNHVDLSSYTDQAATDVAKRVAQRDGVNLSDIKGSGRYGRVRVSDLPSQVARPAQGAVPFSNMRKQIARRLTASYQNIPHYNVQIDVFVDALLAARAAFNAAAQRKTSVNDWLVRAVALTLVEHPDVNINVGDEEIVPFADANVAIAVAIEGGLITPVLHRAQDLPLDQINSGVADLAKRARAGTLTGDDLRDGSFTVSNLGMFGVSQFTALINPPQGAILAVGAARPVPTERDGRVVFGQQMTLTLGCDHRAIDGATAGRFLSNLRTRLEQPQTLLG